MGLHFIKTIVSLANMINFPPDLEYVLRHISQLETDLARTQEALLLLAFKLSDEEGLKTTKYYDLVKPHLTVNNRELDKS